MSEASQAARNITKEMFPESFCKLILPEGENIIRPREGERAEAELMIEKIGREWLLKLTMESIGTAKRNGNGSVTERDVNIAIESMFGNGATEGRVIEKPTPAKELKPSPRYVSILKMIDEHREEQK